MREEKNNTSLSSAEFRNDPHQHTSETNDVRPSELEFAGTGTISAGSVSWVAPQHPTHGQNILPSEPAYNSVDNIIPQNNQEVNDILSKNEKNKVIIGKRVDETDKNIEKT